MKSMPLLVMSVFLGTACASTEAFDFRSDDRPSYTREMAISRFSSLRESGDTQVIDVRLREDYESDREMIPGATYLDPEQIELWSDTLSPDTTVIVYCVAGRWVSQKAAHFLSKKGLDVYTLEGGLEAWQRRDRALQSQSEHF